MRPHRADFRPGRRLGGPRKPRQFSNRTPRSSTGFGPTAPKRRPRYFTSHADVWDSIRSLHVAESEVEEAIGRALGDQSLGRLVDVGTGTGRMIELFGRARSAGDRHRPLVRHAPPRPGEAGGRGHPVQPSPGRHVRAPARRRQRRHDHHSPGAALCALARRGDRRGGARACAGRPTAGRRLRGARARGAALDRRAHPPRLRR